MELTQFVIFFLGVFGLFIWNRTESRSDTRHMDQKLDANRELLREIHAEGQARLDAQHAEIKEMRAETIQIIRSIELEMRDFHRRLCYTEARKEPQT